MKKQEICVCLVNRDIKCSKNNKQQNKNKKHNKHNMNKSSEKQQYMYKSWHNFIKWGRFSAVCSLYELHMIIKDPLHIFLLTRVLYGLHPDSINSKSEWTGRSVSLAIKTGFSVHGSISQSSWWFLLGCSDDWDVPNEDALYQADVDWHQNLIILLIRNSLQRSISSTNSVYMY